MQMTILWICTGIAVLVFGVMIHSVATFRGAQDTIATTSRRHCLVEIIWALIPIAIFIGAALPAIQIIQQSEIRVAEAHGSAASRVVR